MYIAVVRNHLAPEQPPLPQVVSLSDEDLMARVAEDDERAFPELVRRFQSRVTNLISRVLNDRNGADDLAQEVFVRVFVHRRNYRRGSKFSTWLFTIANNLALNILRTRQRKPTIPLNLRDSGPLGPRPAEQLVQDQRPQPHARMQQQELAAIVQQALDTLNERQRIAVVLNKFEDMNYAEISEVMGLSTKAIKSLLSRARENLRQALQGYMDTDGDKAPPPPRDEE